MTPRQFAPGDRILIEATATDVTAAQLSRGENAWLRVGPGDVVAAATSAAEVRATLIEMILNYIDDRNGDIRGLVDAILARPVLGPRLLGQQGGEHPAIKALCRIVAFAQNNVQAPTTQAYERIAQQGLSACEGEAAVSASKDAIANEITYLADAVLKAMGAVAVCRRDEVAMPAAAWHKIIDSSVRLRWLAAGHVLAFPATDPSPVQAGSAAPAKCPYGSVPAADCPPGCATEFIMGSRETDQAVAVLRELEWSKPVWSAVGGWEGSCPICKGTQSEADGHHVDGCRLAAALASSTSIGTGEADTAAPGPVGDEQEGRE